MRRVQMLAGLGAVLLALGCNNTRWNMVKGPQGAGPPPGQTPSVEALVGYLNDNAARLRTIQCVYLDLTCSQGGQSFGLQGKMTSQSPRNFHMEANSLGKTVVDLGSNDKEFWYWVSKGDPYQIYCSYSDLEEGRVKHLPLPFQPDWVIEALGQGSYGPADRYKLEADRDTLRLVERTKSPQGKPVRKVIVFRRRPVQPPSPQVIGFLLIDEATGKEVCTAQITESQLDRGTGGVFPRRIELRWPEQQLGLKMKLDRVTVNPAVDPGLFVRQPMPGVPGFNLATMRPDAAPVQRVGGVQVGPRR